MWFNEIFCTTIIQDVRISNIQHWAEWWAPERTIFQIFIVSLNLSRKPLIEEHIVLKGFFQALFRLFWRSSYPDCKGHFKIMGIVLCPIERTSMSSFFGMSKLVFGLSYGVRNLDMSIRFSLKSRPSEGFPRPEMSQIKAEISLHTNLKLIFHKNVGWQGYQWIPWFL